MNLERMLPFGGKSIIPDTRKISDMKDVIYDSEWFKNASDADIYFMYRDLATCKGDQAIINENCLRYDITIIPPNVLGNELVKTAGHYHPLIEGTEHTFPEVYEVLEGEAHYLLQKLEGDKVTDVIFIEANKGDKIIIPPNYGHVTINPSKKELKMANWVSNEFSSIYEPYKNNRGAIYFELKNGEIIPNENYKDIPELNHIKPVDIPDIGFNKNENMYNLIKEVENLNFLNKPHEYIWLWELVLNI